MPVEIIECNLSDPLHCQAVSELTATYMLDDMGSSEVMSALMKEALIEGLAKHPAKLLLLANMDNRFVGLCTCFINFSTFKVKPYLNIHDVIVLNEYRNMKIGRKLIEKAMDIARQRNYCKLTLEVRNDNQNAMHLYKSLGFLDSTPPMFFWTKTL